jgi:hypothetical protein
VTSREQRREARTRVKALVREARAQVDAMPLVQQARRRRSQLLAQRRALFGALILLLLLFVRCDCDREPTPARAPGEVAAEVLDAGVKTPAPALLKRAPTKARIDPSVRPGYDPGAQQAPSWLDDFRMQVAARSPRLALCFQGADRPGALRWSVALNPASGSVSDHLFEPVGGADLSTAQLACLQRTLSVPGYRVTTQDDAQSLPARVSLVIEF